MIISCSKHGLKKILRALVFVLSLLILFLVFSEKEILVAQNYQLDTGYTFQWPSGKTGYVSLWAFGMVDNMPGVFIRKGNDCGPNNSNNNISFGKYPYWSDPPPYGNPGSGECNGVCSIPEEKNDLGLWVNAGETLCMFSEDYYKNWCGCPGDTSGWIPDKLFPNQWKNVGWMNTNGSDGSLTCGAPGFTAIPVQGYYNQVKAGVNNSSTDIISRQCWADWDDVSWSGGGTPDRDFNDYFFVWAKTRTNTCSVSFSSTSVVSDAQGFGSVSVTVTGKSDDTVSGSGKEIRLWVERRDGNKVPPDTTSPSTITPASQRYINSGKYYYEILAAGCDSSNFSQCSKTTTVKLPAGDYTFHCDAPSGNDNKCTGNPFASINGGPIDFPTWQQCGGADSKDFDIDLVGPSTTQSCTDDGSTASAKISINSGFNPYTVDLYQYRVTGPGYNPSAQTANESETSPFLTFPQVKTFSGLTFGTTYQWMTKGKRWYEPGVWDSWTGRISSATFTCSDTVSCTVNNNPGNTFWGPYHLEQGQPGVSLTAAVTPIGGTVTQVTFAPTTIGVLTALPGKDTLSPYLTTVTPVGSVGQKDGVTSKVYMNGNLLNVVCQDTTWFDIVEPEAWWQIVQGDAWTSGRIGSKVSGSNMFINHIGNSYSGVPGVPVAYDGFTSGLNSSNISNKGWNSESASTYQLDSNSQYDYDYFLNSIPETLTNETKSASDPELYDVGTSTNYTELSTAGQENLYGGYNWYISNGDLQVTNTMNFNGRKDVVFVNGNLTLGDGNTDVNITLNDSNAFIMFIVSGNINVRYSYNRLDGIYVTNKTFNTGTQGPTDDTALTINGSVVAWGQDGSNGINLQRDLHAGNTNPAEIFNYKPNFVLSIPPYFGGQQVIWKEVAP